MERIRGRGKGITVVFRGLILSALVTEVILMILAFVMLKLEPDVKKAEIGILCTYFLSCFLGGIYCGGKMEKGKFVWGMFLGIFYFLLLLAVSFMGDQAVSSDLVQGVTAFFICAGGGMLGGMASH